MKKATICVLLAAAMLLTGAGKISAAGMLTKEGHKEPVVLVHGYMGSTLGMASVNVYWAYYITRLKIDGYDVSWIALPNAGITDVKQGSEALRNFINGVLARTGSSKVDIICHSEGGLVSRYYIKNLGGIDKVDDLVFLSTPHRGTTVASIGPGEAARQMEVGSQFIADLDSDPYLPGNIDYTAIFSNHDEIVVPQQNAFLRGAVNMNVNLLGHGGIMFNEFVYQMAKTAINTDISENKKAIPIEIIKTRMTTNNPVVSLRMKKFNHYKEGATIRKMKISNHQFLTGADWEDYSDTKTWRLDSGEDGLKAVYIKYKDGRNFLLPDESPTYVDYIFYDTHAPSGKINVVPEVTTESSVPIHIDASDNSDDYKNLKGWNFLHAYGIPDLGIKEMLISDRSDFAGAVWRPYAENATVALGAGSGVRSVYVKLRDGAGNESSVMTDSVRVIDPNAGDIGMLSEAGRQPVVLVHGWGGSIVGDVSVYINWVYIYEKLKSEGFDVYRVTLSEGGLQDVKKSAAELQAFIAGVTSKTGVAKVDVVCHSEGGLVARYYIKNLGGAANVDDLVTISTPHRGTVVSTIGPGEASRQMEVANPFLQELNSGDALPGDVQYTALFSHGDEVVVPGKNGFFDGAVNINYVIYGHAGILFSPEPYAAVKNALLYKYSFQKGVRPAAIRKTTGMVTKSKSIDVDLRACNHYAPQTPVTQVLVSTDPLFGGAAWQPAAKSATLDISGKPEGLLGVHVKYRGDDKVESPSYADYVVIDRTPPKGEIAIVEPPKPGATRVKIQISVSDNAEKYGRFKVTNLTEAYGILGIGAKDMMIANSADFAGAAWRPIADSIDWDLTPGAGNKAVYAKFRDVAGNESAPVSVAVYLFDNVNGFMVREEGRDPVVFVHGYAGSIFGDASAYLNWAFYVEKLKAAGYSTHVIALGGGGTQDIMKSAAELRDFVQKVMAETGANSVDIVCHSAGGLVARYYVQFLGGMAYVDDLITISSPHRGLAMASISPGDAGRQLEIGSSFLKLINGHNTTTGNIDTTSIFSNDDSVVVPAENAFYDGALNINVNGYNHATILFNDEIFNIVKNALSIDIGHGTDQLPVYIVKTKMVTANPAVMLKLNYYNHNATQYPAGEMMVSNDKLFRGASWQPFSNSTSWALDGPDGLKAVYVKFKAKDAGVESPAYVDYIYLDRTPPAGALIVNVDKSDPTAVELVITAADNAGEQAAANMLRPEGSFGIQGIGLVDMMVWNSADFTGATWEPFATRKVWSLPNSDGPRSVYVKFRDVAGNESAAVSAAVVKPAEVVPPVISDIVTDIKFDAGWNLVYIPDFIPAEIRSQIAGKFGPGTTVFDIVAKDFRPVNQAWQVSGGVALWQNLKTSFTQQLTFKGRATARGTVSSVMLDKGWSLVGIGSMEPVAAESVTFTLGGQTLALKDAAQQGWVDGRFLSYANEKYAAAEALLPFRAYFIKVYQPCLINLP